MKKNIFFCLITFLFNFNSSAQSTTLDKSKVIDFFQNQQYDDAINYLLPRVNNDSNNIETLGF
jgi:hypothetical protein